MGKTRKQDEPFYALKVDGVLDWRTIDNSREEITRVIRLRPSYACGGLDRVLAMFADTGMLKITNGRRTMVFEIVPIEVTEEQP